jgi:predicted metal-dependent enzyme (double-stranded beta helix superfamily)
MRRKLIWMLVFSGVILGAALYVGSIHATPASGFTGTTIAVGRFEDIEVSNHVFLQEGLLGSRPKKNLWLSFQKTKGSSDLYVQSNLWTPGGTTGWHTHPGHSLITVIAGTVTAYDGHDPSCTPHVYTAGMGFVDPGGDHVHVLRNEGSVEARTIAVQLIPAGATRRIDADGSSSCSF